MILLAGIPSEPPMSLAIESAEQEAIDYVLFNQRESHFVEISIDHRSEQMGGQIRLQEKDYQLNDFAGVYMRLMDHRELPENRRVEKVAIDQNKAAKSALLHELFLEWLEISDCRVCNRGSDMTSNMSKPYQAQLITRAGFKTPVTLITNNISEVKAFQKQHQRVIYKSTSAIRSIVQELNAVKLLDLKNVEVLPTQFQAFVEGENIRVHAVGDRLFPTRIKSEAVDYRYANQENLDTIMEPAVLPVKVEKACLNLSRYLNLPFCGIDLKVTPDHEYYCFEVNPSPGYSYFQQESGQNISGALVRYLEFGNPESCKS